MGDIKHLDEVEGPVIPLLAFPLGPSKAPGGRVSRQSLQLPPHGWRKAAGKWQL